MSGHLARLLLSLLCAVSALPSLRAADLEAFTEDYPPFNFIKDGQPHGMAYDVLQRIARLSGLDIHTSFQPWARSVQDNASTANSLLFTTVRTPKRESQYRWVGPLDDCDISLLKLARRHDIRIASKDDVKYYTIGLPVSGANREVITRLGLEQNNLVYVPSSGDLARMLLAGRFDLLSGVHLSYAYQMRQIGLAGNSIEPAMLLEKGYGCYFAFNPQVNEALFQRFARAFRTLQENGEIRRIKESYVR